MKQKNYMGYVKISVIPREDIKAGDVIFVKAKRKEVDLDAACSCVEEYIGKGIKVIGVPYEIDLEIKHVRNESKTADEE